jgi:hypothetical protein
VRHALFIALALCGGVATAAAQDDSPAPRAHRFTLTGGVSWFGGYPIGENTATLRRNDPGTTAPGGFTLFMADASLRRSAGAETKIGFALTRQLAVEIGGGYARPRLAVAITQDQETASVVLADERISQYIVEAAVLWQFSQLKLGGRARPYLSVGGGYLRQLYENRVKLETGRVAHIGGGVRYWLHGGDAAHRAVGIRAELRAERRSGGIELAGQARVFPVANLFVFFGF